MGQGVDDILDSAYAPIGPAALTLFQEKQKYMFQVFHAKVQTDKGKELFREHLADFDDWSMFKVLKAHGNMSTATKIKSGDLLTYITSSKIYDRQGRGKITGFITHWKEQVCKYHQNVCATELFSNGQKRTMLQNAVQPISELCQVKMHAELQTTITGGKLTFPEYDSLLQSASAQYDTSLTNTKRPNRSVYMSTLDCPHNQSDPDPDVSHILCFYWWQSVYYKVDDSDFPTDTHKLCGHFVGIVKHVGHTMTFKSLTDDTSKIIYRSNVQPANRSVEYNLWLDPLCGIVKSKTDDTTQTQMRIIGMKQI